MLAQTSSSPPALPAPWCIAGVGIAPLSLAEALAAIGDTVASGAHLKIAFANAHFVNEAAREPAFAQILPQFLILADGIGVDIGARLLQGRRFPANLNGTDFVPAVLASHARPLRVGLVGARPGVAERAAARLRLLTPHHDVSALSDGFMTPEQEAGLLAQLQASPVDVLLVAMGNPAQEKWIARHIGAAHARVTMGVGALFDFLAGEVVRAPEWVRALRLEWVWRLAQEPGRLWRRYILGNPAFLLRVLRQKLAG